MGGEEEVVVGVEFAVGAGGADFEAVAGEVMEEVGGAPRVEEGAVVIDAGMVEGKEGRGGAAGVLQLADEAGVVFGGGEVAGGAAEGLEQFEDESGVVGGGGGGVAEVVGKGMVRGSGEGFGCEGW